jgi:hypothetical protein
MRLYAYTTQEYFSCRRSTVITLTLHPFPVWQNALSTHTNL